MRSSSLLFLLSLSAMLASSANAELYTVEVMIPDAYQTVNPGEDLIASIRILSLEESARRDVYVDLAMLDSAGNILFNKRETLALETQLSIVRTIRVPETLPGRYNLKAAVTGFDGKRGTAEASFNVSLPVISSVRIPMIAGLVLIIILIISLSLKNRIKIAYEKHQISRQVKQLIRQQSGKK